MNQLFKIPKTICAGEDAAARLKAKQREILRDKLRKGETVKANAKGNALTENGDANFSIPETILATEDAAARMKAKQREILKNKLLDGETVKANAKGNALTNNGDANFAIPKTILASQWYEKNPTLLAMEKIAMQRSFPQFILEKLDDGRLCWSGVLEPGVYESKFGKKMQYHLMAVYDNNHPNQKMGSSVKVYPVMPDVDELIQICGFIPLHLLRDEVGNAYLCTNEAGYQKIGVTTTTAASVMGWAIKWLIAYELVLTGDLPQEVFNTHGGI